MKTQVINWAANEKPQLPPMLPVVKKVNHALCYVAKVVSNLIAALVVVLGTYAAMMSPAVEPILQAGIAISGLIFLAMAIDAENKPTAWLLAATGIALPILAKLSSIVAQEFILAAATLLVVWITASILKR